MIFYLQEEIAYGYEPLITLKTLIIAGEYAHLHRYQECEINIWKLAYALASELKNNYAIIYGINLDTLPFEISRQVLKHEN